MAAATTYTTLVVPWDYARNRVDIGTGVANLPDGAPDTWDHLREKVEWLIGWATRFLGTMKVVPLATGLVPSVVSGNATDLYVQEVSDAMRRAPSVGEDSSTSVLGVSNVVSLRTLLFPGASSPETGLLSDDNLEANKAMLDRQGRVCLHLPQRRLGELGAGGRRLRVLVFTGFQREQQGHGGQGSV